ncbi:MAG: response regulator transcription factor [Gemmatimonadetes bacterium]|nr:response regulator transcription factor [Gemmatimonadota bacterium]MYG15313.1 response regulator transcription factor [Gemmatimonadota bacterium]
MIRVVIADDHHLIRQGLRDLLSKETDIQVVAEATDGRDVIDVVNRIRADVIVMDVEMPGIGGIEATKRIRASFSDIQVVMMSMHSDPDLIRKALDSGARGYVLKKSAGEELVKAIRTVCRGVTYQSRAMDHADYLYGEYPHGTPPRLTPREREVLRLIASGLSNPQIAETMRISIKTVQNHRINLMAKLNTHSLPELIRTAIKLGLINLEE